MRIAILSNTFPPDGRGGAEAIAALQADVLYERGHEVSVWAARNDADEEVQTEALHRFPSAFGKLGSMKIFSRLMFHLADRGVNHRVTREILEWKPDVLMTHNVTGCGIGTSSYLQRKGICWIHTLHDVQLFEPSGKIRSDRRNYPHEYVWRACWAAIRRMSFGIPNILISPSGWLLHMHEHYGFKGKKMVILPNPMDVKPDAPPHTFHQPSTLAFVGRLSYEKGIDVFADVCRRLIRKGIVNRIIVAGDGPHQHMLPAEAMIEIRGRVSNEDAHAIIAESDLLVAPSRLAENQPTVILEAMAEGTPVISSDTQGARELLAGTGAALIPWHGNVGDAFSNAAISILSDVKQWHEVSKAMKSRAFERHESEHYADTLMELVKSCNPDASTDHPDQKECAAE